MPSIFLRPNAVNTNDTWSVTGGVSADEAVADDLDSTYVTPDAGGAFIMYEMDTYTTLSIERVKRVRMQFRARTTGSSTDLTVRVRLPDGTILYSSGSFIQSTSFANLTTPWIETLTDIQQEASQQDILDSLLTSFQVSSFGFVPVDLAEVHLELDVWEAVDTPVVEVERGFQLNQGSVEPQPVVTSTEPTISFYTPSINDGIPSEWSRQATLYDVNGNPLNGNGSSVLSSISTDPNASDEVVFGTELEIGSSYRVEVMYGKNDVDGRTLWSEWGFVEFDVAGPGPSAPPSILLNTRDAPNLLSNPGFEDPIAADEWGNGDNYYTNASNGTRTSAESYTGTYSYYLMYDSGTGTQQWLTTNQIDITDVPVGGKIVVRFLIKGNDSYATFDIESFSDLSTGYIDSRSETLTVNTTWTEEEFIYERQPNYNYIQIYWRPLDAYIDDVVVKRLLDPVSEVLYAGSSQVAKIYSGTTQVWP